MSLDILMRNFTDNLSRFGRIMSPRSMYMATFLSFLSSGLACRGLLMHYEPILKERLGMHLPSPVRAEVLVGSLRQLASKIIDAVNETITKRDAVELVEGKADLSYVLRVLLRELGRISYVVLYDCLSIIELLTVTSFMKSKNYATVFPSMCFINPLGLTRFITKQAQLTEGTMRDVLKTIMKPLGASDGSLVREVDQKVHGYGYDVHDFLTSVCIERIISACDEYAQRGPTLIASDHGYDVVHTPEGLHIAHGFPGEQRDRQIALNLSRIAPIAVVFKRR